MLSLLVISEYTYLCDLQDTLHSFSIPVMIRFQKAAIYVLISALHAANILFSGWMTQTMHQVIFRHISVTLTLKRSYQPTFPVFPVLKILPFSVSLTQCSHCSLITLPCSFLARPCRRPGGTGRNLC